MSCTRPPTARRRPVRAGHFFFCWPEPEGVDGSRRDGNRKIPEPVSGKVQADSDQLAWHQLLEKSSARERRPQWTSWGQGASVSQFSAAVPGLGMSGTSATGSMGMDYEHGRLLMGFAMTHSLGEIRSRGGRPVRRSILRLVRRADPVESGSRAGEVRSIHEQPKVHAERQCLE